MTDNKNKKIEDFTPPETGAPAMELRPDPEAGKKMAAVMEKKASRQVGDLRERRKYDLPEIKNQMKKLGLTAQIVPGYGTVKPE